jgi:hypothetical protein
MPTATADRAPRNRALFDGVYVNIQRYRFEPETERTASAAS